MSSKSQGSSEQRKVKEALAAAGGAVKAPTWSGVRRELDLQMNTANVEATFKALGSKGEIKHSVQEGNIVLAFT